MSEPMPLVVVYPRGQLTVRDKAALRAHGIVPIEADDPKAVAQLQFAAPLVCTGISGDAIVRSALTALASEKPADGNGYITGVGRACHAFVQAMARAMLEQRS